MNSTEFSRRQFLNRAVLGSTALGIHNILSTPETLQAAPTEENHVLRFAHLTDIHVYHGRGSAQGMSEAFKHAQSQKNPPEFIITGGDAIYDSLETNLKTTNDQWKIWETVLKNDCSLPLYHCIGNHDVWGWKKKESGTKGTEPGWGKEMAMDHFQMKQRYYTFEKKGWKFIVLDSIHPDERITYRGELDKEQFDWFKNQLKLTPETQPVIVVSHIPIITSSDYVFRQPLKADPSRLAGLKHQDDLKIMQLLGNHPNVKICISGHTHTTEVIQANNITFVNSGAVCGLWWKGDHHHTDEGYNMIDLYSDGSFKHQYITYGWEAQH